MSEEVCDAAVIEHGCAPRDYARCLLELAERFSPRSAERVAGAGVLPLRSALSKRVQNILDESRRYSSRVSRRARALAALFVIIGAAAPFIIGVANAKNEKPDLSSPEATVSSFVAAINAKDFEAAASCVQNALPKSDLQSQKYRLENLDFRVTIEDLKTKKTATSAIVNLRTMPLPKVPNAQYEPAQLRTKFKLNRFANEWKIISDEYEQMQSFDLLRHLVFLIAPPGLDKLRPWLARNSPATITGRVLHDDGKPAANVAIDIDITQQQLSKLPGAPKNASPFREWQLALPDSIKRHLARRVTTDAKGNYAIAGLAATTYDIAPPTYHRFRRSTQIQDFPKEVAVAPQRVHARHNKSVRAPKIQLTRGAIVNVHVLDQADNKPLRDILIVNVTGKDRKSGSAVQTDQNGVSRFRFPIGKVHIAVGGIMYLNGSNSVAQSGKYFYAVFRNVETSVDGKKVDGSSSIDFIVQKGQTRDVTFRLKKYVTPKPKISRTNSTHATHRPLSKQ